MAEFHFVEDYERHVRDLLQAHPLDKAMSLAVGGDYEKVGAIELAILRHAGLVDGMSLIDLGCGSGRLADALGREMRLEYLGTDIVQSLLDYARTKTPANYRFALHRDLSLPAEDASADMVSAFSVFTHLLHEESFLYLQDGWRTLRRGGRIVFSFLEFASPAHWAVFQRMLDERRSSARSPLNTFIDRDAIRVWAKHLSYEVECLIDGTQAPWKGTALGQSIAILRKPR